MTDRELVVRMLEQCPAWARLWAPLVADPQLTVDPDQAIDLIVRMRAEHVHDVPQDLATLAGIRNYALDVTTALRSCPDAPEHVISALHELAEWARVRGVEMMRAMHAPEASA